MEVTALFRWPLRQVSLYCSKLACQNVHASKMCQVWHTSEWVGLRGLSDRDQPELVGLRGLLVSEGDQPELVGLKGLSDRDQP